jgi:hypothetical protein
VEEDWVDFASHRQERDLVYIMGIIRGGLVFLIGSIVRRPLI